MSGPISSIVEALVVAGASPEMILAAVKASEEVLGQDAEARRAYDRDRQRRRRELYPSNWEVLRATVFERDNYICTYCGEQTDRPECDHIVPLFRGGSNDLENLTTACRPCNTGKGNRTVQEWRANA